jgi:hypothetical protein
MDTDVGWAVDVAKLFWPLVRHQAAASTLRLGTAYPRDQVGHD